MKIFHIIAISMAFLQAPAVSAAGAAQDRQHFTPPGEEDVPEIDITAHPTLAPSASPTVAPTLSPSATPSARPSPSPSANPSSSPSAKPSTSPSIAPSPSPSHEPSNRPSTKPSFSPSASPSSHPSFVPSAMPSQSPSHAPTSSPSVSPSMYPSFVPSDMPSQVPSDVPTKADCESKDGSFGVFPNEDAIIKYSYEVELISVMDADEVQESVLPSLENGIIDSILPSLFTDACGHSLLTRKLSVQRRLLEIQGISKYPEDLVYDDIACSSVEDGNSCFVVSGELTIFAEDQDTLDKEGKKVKKAIEDEMNAGNLNDSQEDIVRVSYVDIDPQLNNVEEQPPGFNDEDNKIVTISPVPFIVGGAVLLAVLVGVAYRQHRKNADSNAESDADTQIGGSQLQGTVEAADV